MMAARTFSCSNCNESFSLHLPENTINAAYTKCEDKDMTHHNLERIIQCQNWEHSNIVYYCIHTHPLVAMGSWQSL